MWRCGDCDNCSKYEYGGGKAVVTIRTEETIETVMIVETLESVEWMESVKGRIEINCVESVEIAYILEFGECRKYEKYSMLTI